MLYQIKATYGQKTSCFAILFSEMISPEYCGSVPRIPND
jgi:hypothetical protein